LEGFTSSAEAYKIQGTCEELASCPTNQPNKQTTSQPAKQPTNQTNQPTKPTKPTKPN
jgi:hypothetical protein